MNGYLEILKQRYQESKSQYEILDNLVGQEKHLLEDWKRSLSELENKIKEIESENGQ